MTRSDMLSLWKQAIAIDPTLRLAPHQVSALTRRQLRPQPYSRPALYAAMAAGQPIIFSDFPVPVRNEGKLGTGAAVLQALERGFAKRHTVRVRRGRAGDPKPMPVRELLRRWRSDRGLVSVTDFHIRGSSVMRSIDCSHLSDFNLLACRDDIGLQEMLTMVISSAGTYTDSHTDDPDGSNHCFVGRKLWLVWDTFRGIACGLQDVERSADGYFGQAAFSIGQFLKVPGARWFLVETGQTLFLPGHLTHKVITLEDYLGVGSFFVMLPSYLRTLARWTRHTPLWALREPPERRLALVDRITSRVTERVAKLAQAPAGEGEFHGIRYLRDAVRRWSRTASRRQQRVLRSNPASAALLSAVQTTVRAAQGRTGRRPRRRSGQA